VSRIVQVKRLADVSAFSEHCAAIGAELPIDATIEATGPLAEAFEVTDGSAAAAPS
jgi:hypothetical protein